MRIAMINYEFPPLGGGAGRATRYFARELAALGDRVEIITTRFRDQAKLEAAEGYVIHRVRALRSKMESCTPLEMITFIISAMRSATRLLADLKPEATIAFFGLPSGPVGWWLKKWTGTPYLIMLRGGDIPGFCPEELANYHRLTSPVLRFLWKRSARVVANSQGAKKLALTTGWNIPIEVIPNGVDADLFFPPHVLPSNPQPRILFVGRLSGQKALPVLFRALASVQLRNIDWRLDLVGDGPQKSMLKKLAHELSIEQKVRFLGWWSSERLLSEGYQKADLFVLPSLDEGMPNALLEAMACGLPVIATRVPGSEEIIKDGENGLLVHPGQDEPLALALTNLLTSPSNRQLLGREARLYAQNHSWRSMAIKLRGLLADCI
ncbi:hypothetical protein AAU61_01095 [Desulfocarbo indianensis]|nr:hypothetical protein AAU61_01095 [Desulfocarbo indianensis]